MTTPTPAQAVRLSVCTGGIHAEPDVTVVLDVPCFEALPRELPHLYLSPSIREIKSERGSFSATTSDGDDEEDEDNDQDHDPPYVDWESIHESMQRAYFLNNTCLARDPIASRLIISKIHDAFTSLDGAVWRGFCSVACPHPRGSGT